MAKIARLTVRRWGNGLALRIPAAIARSARLSVGVSVELTVQGGGVLVSAIGRPNLTLEQKLASFDPARHGGEALVSDRVGNEIF